MIKGLSVRQRSRLLPEYEKEDGCQKEQEALPAAYAGGGKHGSAGLKSCEKELQMKEYTYQLEKEDYREWIRWNIKKHDQRKAKLITVGVMLALLAVTLIGNFSSGRPIAAAIGSVVTFIGLGAIMLYFISPQNQEKMIWKKSGLKKMEKTGFPTINLAVREDGFDLFGPDREAEHVHYQYTSLEDIVELERLLLLKTSDGSYQFVAKRVFTEEEKQEFLSFLREKMADARENPEKYRRTETEAIAGTGSDETEGNIWEEGYVVRNQNTAGMGKIGQMANILARSGEEEETDSRTGDDADCPEQEEEKAEEL